MRTIVHLSDVHFGRVDYAVVAAVVEIVNRIKPDLVAVSGDLTQRARSAQFAEARAFLDALPRPQIVVPGNHDISLYNVFNRFVRPLDKYRHFITADLQPFYSDAEIAVAGLNTARSLTVKGGRINEAQVAGVREKLCALPDEMFKIIVTHHPFDLPANFEETDLVGRAQMAMQTFSTCGADLFLAGHLHVTNVSDAAMRYKMANGRVALFVQAGTATSTRGRGETNSFNVIRVDFPYLVVEHLSWQNSGFIVADSQRFLQTPQGIVKG